jgi:hypothetical protein
VKLIAVKLSEAQIKALDVSVQAKLYPSRSEAIRMAVRDLLQVDQGVNRGMPLAKRGAPSENRLFGALLMVFGPSHDVVGLGDCLIIQRSVFDATWTRRLEAEGYRVTFGTLDRRPAVFISLKNTLEVQG